jgi:hypothetical protein
MVCSADLMRFVDCIIKAVGKPALFFIANLLPMLIICLICSISYYLFRLFINDLIWMFVKIQ